MTISMLLIKFDHTRLVTDYCGHIARSLKWTEADVDAMRLVGYFHDYGSVLEIATTDSFLHVCDHGFDGYWIIKNSVFGDLLNENQLHAIRYHNSPDVVEPCNKFLKVLRDADKLAVFELTNELINKGELEKYCRKFLKCGEIAYAKSIYRWLQDINYEWTSLRILDMHIKERLESLLNG